MPPHIKQRKDRGSTYYLVDGDLIKSLKTRKRGSRSICLEQYIKGKYGLQSDAYSERIFMINGSKRRSSRLFRRALIRDYKQHFRTHILPKF